MVIVCSDSQPLNTPFANTYGSFSILPIVFKLLGNETDVSDRQFVKVQSSIVVKPSGISIDRRPEPANAPLPILVIFLGILKDFSPLQPENI